MIEKKTHIPVAENEAERLEALSEYEVLDGKMDEELNDLVNLASEICDAPISLVTLLDNDRQWFKAKCGMEENGSPRDVAFCNHTILQEGVLEVEDALKDERFKDNPFVTGESDGIRFYAGVPLTNRDGLNLGSLCVIDTKPRKLNDFQTKTLKTLARQAVRKLDYDLNQKKLCRHANSLEAANKKLHKLSMLNVNLLSAMAHDLRNNLAGSESVLSFIQERVDLSSDLDTLVEAQLKSTNQAYELLSDMVTWGSSYSKSGEIKKNSINSSELIDTVLTDISGHAHRKGVQLKNLVSDDLEVRTDSEMLKFIFRNLVQNAVKFSEGGTVKVDFDEEKRAFMVSDNGQGMSARELEKLFTWDRSKVKKGTAGEPGSGIGLMLCRDFAERHGGDIWAESEEGKGTTVFFTLEPKDGK